MKPEGAQPSSEEICSKEATALAELLRTKKVSAVEVMKAHLNQIVRVNTKVDAIVTLVDEEQLLTAARSADEALAKDKVLGPLHGLPIAVKDLHATKGIRTTYGSPLYKDDIPKTDCLLVEREKKAGGIVIGKINVPEFGLGSQTFSPVFGATLNPYDLIFASSAPSCRDSIWNGKPAPSPYLHKQLDHFAPNYLNSLAKHAYNRARNWNPQFLPTFLLTSVQSFYLFSPLHRKSKDAARNLRRVSAWQATVE